MSLVTAADNNDVASLRSLLYRGASPETPQAWCSSYTHVPWGLDDVDSSLTSELGLEEVEYLALPLHTAVIAGNYEAAALLLDAGADPLARDSRGRTTLTCALYGLDTEPSTHVNQWCTVNTHPTHSAILAELILPALKTSRSSVLNSPQPEIKNITPLCLAAYLGKTVAVACFLENHADPNSCDMKGATPLMYAARDNHAESVRLLLEYGADPEICDANGWTAMQYCKRRPEIYAELEAASYRLSQMKLDQRDQSTRSRNRSEPQMHWASPSSSTTSQADATTSPRANDQIPPTRYDSAVDTPPSGSAAQGKPKHRRSISSPPDSSEETVKAPSMVSPSSRRESNLTEASSAPSPSRKRREPAIDNRNGRNHSDEQRTLSGAHQKPHPGLSVAKLAECLEHISRLLVSDDSRLADNSAIRAEVAATWKECAVRFPTQLTSLLCSSNDTLPASHCHVARLDLTSMLTSPERIDSRLASSSPLGDNASKLKELSTPALDVDMHALLCPQGYLNENDSKQGDSSIASSRSTPFSPYDPAQTRVGSPVGGLGDSAHEQKKQRPLSPLSHLQPSTPEHSDPNSPSKASLLSPTSTLQSSAGSTSFEVSAFDGLVLQDNLLEMHSDISDARMQYSAVAIAQRELRRCVADFLRVPPNEVQRADTVLKASLASICIAIRGTGMRIHIENITEATSFSDTAAVVESALLRCRFSLLAQLAALIQEEIHCTHELQHYFRLHVR